MRCLVLLFFLIPNPPKQNTQNGFGSCSCCWSCNAYVPAPGTSAYAIPPATCPPTPMPTAR